MVDQQLWKARQALLEQPASASCRPSTKNSAATACSGTQRVELGPGAHRRWRVRDVVRQGARASTAPATRSSTAMPTARRRSGGVLVVAGDDHGCVSSSMPHQSDLAMQAWQHAGACRRPAWPRYWSSASTAGRCRASPAPGSASRRCREVVESGATVDLDLIDARVGHWRDADAIRAATGHGRLRRAALPLARPALARASRRGWRTSSTRCAPSRALNAIDRHVIAAPQRARWASSPCGKAHLDLHGGAAPARDRPRRCWTRPACASTRSA